MLKLIEEKETAIDDIGKNKKQETRKKKKNKKKIISVRGMYRMEKENNCTTIYNIRCIEYNRRYILEPLVNFPIFLSTTPLLPIPLSNRIGRFRLTIG